MTEPQPNCPPQIRDDLKAYLDGELAPTARRRVQDHVRTCASCTKELTMLKETQTKLRDEFGEQDVSDDLRGRIRAQIDASGIEDVRTRKADARSGLIPRRYLPFAITLSTVITIAALYLIIAPIREKMRQATTSDRKQLGVALLQYYQDYDEKFPAPVSSPGIDARPTWPVTVHVRVNQTQAALNAILEWQVSDEETDTGGNAPATVIITMTGAEMKRLLPRIKSLGQINPHEIHTARNAAFAHPNDNIQLTIRIIPEAAR